MIVVPSAGHGLVIRRPRAAAPAGDADARVDQLQPVRLQLRKQKLLLGAGALIGNPA